MPAARVNGIDIWYELDGDGPRVLFLNGSGATIERSGPLLAPFRRRFELLVHDQRGLGRTSVPTGPYTMADYAADAAALLDHVGWSTCRVVGVSFGGMVAQELAVSWPERIDRLALVCTSPGGSAASYPLHELAALPEHERADRSIRLLDTRFSAEWLAEHPSDQVLVEVMAAGRLAERSAQQLRGEAEQLGARRHHDVLDRLGRITCPTLVASGRFDGIAPVANGAAIAERVPDAELRVYEGGHAFWVQDPAALPAILDFLAQP